MVVKVRAEQLEVLREVPVARFVEATRVYLREEEPEALDEASDDEIGAFVRGWVDRTRGYGIEDSYLVQQLCLFAIWLGEDFDTAEATAEAGAILRNARISPEDVPVRDGGVVIQCDGGFGTACMHTINRPTALNDASLVNGWNNYWNSFTNERTANGRMDLYADNIQLHETDKDCQSFLARYNTLMAEERRSPAPSCNAMPRPMQKKASRSNSEDMRSNG